MINVEVIDVEAIDTGGGWTVDMERMINSQLSCQCEKTIASVDLGGRSMINTESINSQLTLLPEKMIASVDQGGLTPPETFRAQHGLATSKICKKEPILNSKQNIIWERTF